jgi:hypothetical protein
MSASFIKNASQCSCNLKITSSSTWTQDCQCCLADDQVRASLIPAVTCSGFNPMKEQCSCTNATLSNTTNATRLTCNCMNSVSNALSTGLSFPNSGQCDCADILIGTKTCNCCIPYDVQVHQMTPTCTANSSLEACMCSGNTTSKSCACSSQRANLGGLTFASIPTNASSCYCTPGSDVIKACNCCVSETQFLQVKPTCVANKESTSCQCSSKAVNGSLACSCANRYFFNTVSSLSLNSQNCACASPANAN